LKAEEPLKPLKAGDVAPKDRTVLALASAKPTLWRRLCCSNGRTFGLADPPVRLPNLNRIVRSIVPASDKRFVVALAFDGDRGL
jgi:hypothetical protein